MDYDFCGWATRNNIECSDGRTIMKDAFKQNDGQKVPLVWNHQHNDPNEVLGHALLENRAEGVYAYCKFNDTDSGQTAKLLVTNGDVDKLSIYANKLKSQMNHVVHGCIREVSLVLAGANPGAYIEEVMAHSDDSDEEWEATIYTDSPISIIEHSDEASDENSDEDSENSDNNEEGDPEMEKEEKTIGEVFDTLTDEQKEAVYQIIALSEEDDNEYEEEGEDEDMKHNVFDNDMRENNNQVLTHADQMAIMELAKQNNVGSFQRALNIYCEENGILEHSGFTKDGEDAMESLFPDYKLINPGAPEKIDDDFTWVERVLDKTHKSPISRVRTRYVNLKEADIRAMGYEKTKEKKLIGSLPLLGRSHDPQTVYVKDKLERDDIIDITDFDIVAYQKGIMTQTLKRELATAILIGDGRTDGEEGKIKEAHIRSIWNDDELYTIHADVDLAKAKQELQGSDTSVHFGENYIYAEAIITSALYAREKYKGSGSLDFYCTPHLLNVMLLARDLNGRRIYSSKNDLAAALNVNGIYTIEQFENKTRKEENKTKKLLGLFVNMSDYQVGSTKGGQITSFDDFDIDFNQYKYLMETRLSGALTKPFAAIALEEDVTVNPTVNPAG